MNIRVAEIISAFQNYLTAHDGYIPNTSGEIWTEEKQAKATNAQIIKYGRKWIGHHVEDCSGAFVRAYKAHGMNIYHGSNRIARKYVVQLLTPSMAKPGMVAFKGRNPGAKYYDLPSEYRPCGKYYNGDTVDYYHIGLVDDDPHYVLNAQSVNTGFVRSKLSDGWCAVGYLKAVDYGREEEKMQRRVSGGKLNMREKPDKSAKLIMKIPDGATVTIDSYGDTWCHVVYNGKEGYVMTKYLEEVNDSSSGATQDDLVNWLQKALEANESERQALTMMQQLLTGAVG